MSRRLVGERSAVLPGEPASVGLARRMVADTLRSWGLDALVDDARLLVSEVVTNAVLHAGTDVVVSIRRRDSGVRIEVADGSPVVPTPRSYHGDAVTGRGLQILESTASGWGTSGNPSADGGGGGGGDGGGGGGGGKVVWFDLGGPAAAAPRGGQPRPAPAAGWTTVCWEGLPPRLTKASLEHGDAMIRELALLSFDESGPLPMSPIVTPALELGELLTAIDLAIEAGEPVIDLSLRIPADPTEAALDRLALVDEADRMAADGELLVPAALPEINDCRHWLLGEMVAQAGGREPTRWKLAAAAPARPQDLQSLSDEEVVLLGDGLARSIVADQENRIVFAGEEAAHLLGWAPADLVGRRLTDIVPPDLREAHLVGFTRCQLTGRAALSGTPLALRARRADGSEIDATVTLGALPRRDGRFRHVGRITPR